MFPPKTPYAERNGRLIAYQSSGFGPIDLLRNGMSSNIDLAWDSPRTAARLRLTSPTCSIRR